MKYGNVIFYSKSLQLGYFTFVLYCKHYISQEITIVIDCFFYQVFNEHSKLLGKGFALSHPPTIMQALEGNLPFCWQSNERSFLKDFVACNPGTSGGRMARYINVLVEVVMV